MQARLVGADERPMQRAGRESRSRAGGRDAAAVRAGDRVDDREPETGAAARPRLVGAAEALEGRGRKSSGKPALSETPSTTVSPVGSASSRPRLRRA